MRLDKLLAHMGYGTRKEVKYLIRKGHVHVNGEVIKNDDIQVDENNDDIQIFDENIKYEKYIYIMLNKPEGYISATYDNFQDTVLELVSEYAYYNLFPVGRLDKDSTGLLLISNDGMLAHKLLSPTNHVFKKYLVSYDGEFKEEYFDKFKKGITLDDNYKCKEAKVELLENNKAYVYIQEGKFHQVKRMFQSLNMKVTSLKRIEFGSLKLDESLKPGDYRLLTKEEIEKLYE